MWNPFVDNAFHFAFESEVFGKVVIGYCNNHSYATTANRNMGFDQ